MWSLLGVESAIGMQLTESMAMLPAAAVSAVVFANPCAQYFAVGKITADQVADYAARKAVPLEQVQKWLEPMLKCALPSIGLLLRVPACASVHSSVHPVWGAW